jgi:hypothetical protein
LRGQASFIATAAVEQESPELPLRQTKVLVNRLAGLLGDFVAPLAAVG